MMRRFVECSLCLRSVDEAKCYVVSVPDRERVYLCLPCYAEMVSRVVIMGMRALGMFGADSIPEKRQKETKRPPCPNRPASPA